MSLPLGFGWLQKAGRWQLPMSPNQDTEEEDRGPECGGFRVHFTWL